MFELFEFIPFELFEPPKLLELLFRLLPPRLLPLVLVVRLVVLPVRLLVPVVPVYPLVPLVLPLVSCADAGVAVAAITTAQAQVLSPRIGKPLYFAPRSGMLRRSTLFPHY